MACVLVANCCVLQLVDNSLSRPNKKVRGQAARPIRTAGLKPLRALYLRLINLVVCQGPSGAYARENVSWRRHGELKQSALSLSGHGYPWVALVGKLGHRKSVPLGPLV